MKDRLEARIWAARVLIGLVIVWNLQAALLFLVNPGAFVPGFELSGVPGMAAVRGVAILFVMWNIPYLAACWQPRRNRVSSWEALVMQAIGVVGEGTILLTLPAEHAVLQASILRFLAFDAAGLLALVGAVVLAGG